MERGYLFKLLDFVFPIVVVQRAAEEDDLCSDYIRTRQISLSSPFGFHASETTTSASAARLSMDNDGGPIWLIALEEEYGMRLNLYFLVVTAPVKGSEGG